jgi:hypothetical protein
MKCCEKLRIECLASKWRSVVLRFGYSYGAIVAQWIFHHTPQKFFESRTKLFPEDNTGNTNADLIQAEFRAN